MASHERAEQPTLPAVPSLRHRRAQPALQRAARRVGLVIFALYYLGPLVLVAV